MIIDTLSNLNAYSNLHPLISVALDKLAALDYAKLDTGEHELSGRDLFACVAEEKGRAEDEAPLEAHRKYLDIQIVLRGEDRMGWKPLANCQCPTANYDEERDIQFFSDVPDCWIPVRSGQFVIFFPEDAHAPLVSDGLIRKMVLKLAV